MPNSSFNVNVTVYSRDSSTVEAAGVRVIVTNFTKSNESVEGLTNASGQVSLDLGACDTQWENNDKIYAVAVKGRYSATARLRIDSAESNWNVNLYLKAGSSVIANNAVSVSGDATGRTGDVRLLSAHASAGGTARDFLIIERRTDEVIWQGKCAANGSDRIVYPDGKRVNGGFYTMYIVQGTNIHDQSAGVANAIGDVRNTAVDEIASIHWR